MRQDVGGRCQILQAQEKWHFLGNVVGVMQGGVGGRCQIQGKLHMAYPNGTFLASGFGCVSQRGKYGSVGSGWCQIQGKMAHGLCSQIAHFWPQVLGLTARGEGSMAAWVDGVSRWVVCMLSESGFGKTPPPCSHHFGRHNFGAQKQSVSFYQQVKGWEIFLTTFFLKHISPRLVSNIKY